MTMKKKLLLKLNNLYYGVRSKIIMLRMTEEEKRRLSMVALVIK